jgi:multisite-specific tRNA:(cytosine-C5)-methyltransferase
VSFASLLDKFTVFSDSEYLQSKRTQSRDFGKRADRDDTWTEYRHRNVTWENITEKAEAGSLNEEFEAYYKEQRVCPEGEWDAFMRTLRTPLPITFRINGSGKFASELRSRLENNFFSKFVDEKLEVDGVFW